MAEEKIHKIIYFDKETIRNILQERNKGEKTHILDLSLIHISEPTRPY